jgi:hypothetical protein
VYARSTTIDAQVDSIDRGILHIRDDVMPAMSHISGCLGLSLLVDRESGRCIATSGWKSQEEMRASAEKVDAIRDRAADILGGSPSVQEWEIAFLHRNHYSNPGACVRATWIQLEPRQLDSAVDMFKMSSLPVIEDLEGFCSASLMMDRDSGRAVLTVTYDSVAALNNNRERAEQVRTSGTAQANARIEEVREFELALAHLHVPELV